MSGFVSPAAIIGEPPEHRSFRWLYLEAKAAYHLPVIHPTAIIEALATVDSGIDSATTIGEYCLVMKHSHIGHDATIGGFCNIAPGALIGGYCRIGDNVKVGLGASIRPRVTVGEGAVIGAGAVVVKDVPAGEMWAGNPARRLPPKHTTPSGEELDPWMEWYYSWHNSERG